MNGYFSQEAMETFTKSVGKENFSEGLFDFTRCIRPDGSAYGTGGTCRKGTEGKVPLHQHEKGSSEPTPLERGLAKLKRLERRINDPDYSPTDAEMERYGRLKNAIEGARASSEKKDKQINIPTKSPAFLESDLRKITNNPKASKRDFKDVLDEVQDKIEEVKATIGTGRTMLGILRGGLNEASETAKKLKVKNLERMHDEYSKIYKRKFEA